MARQGHRSGLIREALAKAAALGHSSAVLIGRSPAIMADSDSIPPASISYPGVPGEYTLACELTPGALRNISGAISLPDC